MISPEQKIKKHVNNWLKSGLPAAALLAFFILFAFWSGVPTGENAAAFWIGVAVLVIVLTIFAVAVWFLMFSPMPDAQVPLALPIPAAYFQQLALLLAMGQFGVLIGAFWDEIWHRQYGVPFGEDFFWRPHMLLYFGIGVSMALAFFALIFVFWKGKGSIRQRFRANPIIGLLILAGGLLLYVLPADPIWHSIYGEDLTAWGIPHLMLFLAFDSIMLLAIAIHMSKQPVREWRTARRLNSVDLLPLFMFAAMSLTLNQFFTTEWDGGATFAQARPEWLLPVLIVGGAALVGVLANHTLKMIGAATLSGILALALRLALILLFQAGGQMRANAWVLALPSLVFIDLWYLYRPGWAVAGIAAAVGMVAMLTSTFADIYPNNPITNLPLAIVMVTSGSMALAWLGVALGDYLATANKQLEVAGSGFRTQMVTLVVVAAFVGFVIFFVITAKPPV